MIQSVLSLPTESRKRVYDNAIGIASSRNVIQDDDDQPSFKYTRHSIVQDSPKFGVFPHIPKLSTISERIQAFVDETSDKEIRTFICIVCAREANAGDILHATVSDILQYQLLQPFENHVGQTLKDGQLLHWRAIQNDQGNCCTDCHKSLQEGKQPVLSLANNLWIGEIPFELSILTLPERLLVAK